MRERRARRWTTPLLALALVAVLLVAAHVFGVGPGDRRVAAFNPCLEPREWRPGAIDPRFDLPPARFRAAIEAAVAVWEGPTGRALFRYDATDGMPIRLVYDHRQAELDAVLDRRRDLEEIGAAIDSDRALHERRLAAFGQELDRHNAAVQRWNDAGRGTAEERRRLQQETARLRRREAELDRTTDALRQRILQFNERVEEAGMHVPSYVEAGSFEATIHTRGRRRTEASSALTIFQFGDDRELVRILAHELGHSLGLGHVSDPDAVMHDRYRFEGDAVETRLAPADIEALIGRCGPVAWNETLPG